MTAVSAIVFFLGLLFGFQRPSRLYLPRLRATVLLLLPCTPFNLGAAFFISKRLFCQAAVAAPFSPLLLGIGFNIAPERFVSSCRGGAESTSLPLPLSTLSVDSFFLPAPASSPSRLPPFRGVRLLPPPRSESTPFVDFLFPLSLLRPELSAAVAASSSRPRGAPSTSSPHWSQPPSSTLFFPSSPAPSPF